MVKGNNPLLSDEFLDELAKEINQQCGESNNDQNVETINNNL